MARRKASAPKGKGPSFEEALERLERIVHDLEEEDLPLERSLAVFEEGVGLARLLGEKLNEAERRVELLVKDASGRPATVPFPGSGAEAGGEAGDASGGGEGDDDEGGEDEGDDEDQEEEDGGDGDEGPRGPGQDRLPF